MSDASPKRIVLAYSGGLDTSVILKWLVERYGAEVIAYCADVGQAEELAGLEVKALATGATRYVQEDLREAFALRYVFPSLRAAAIYEGEYLLGTALARPCIVEGLMRVAREAGADAVAHGATGKGNDQVRFELGAFHFDPEVRIIAPWREWNLRSRSDCIAYAAEHRIPVVATAEKPYSMDRNLFHVSYEGGILEDPWAAPPREMFLTTRAPEDAPAAGVELAIDFEAGDPVAIDGVRMSPATLLARLNDVAGAHGVGRVDVVEDRFVGMKSRGVYETPGGTVLHKAHRAVESLTLDRETMLLRDGLVPQYAAMVYRGFWFSPEREALQTMIDEIQKPVSGTVRVRLYKGSVTVTGRRAPRSLYDAKLVTFERDEVYDQRDAGAFIRLNALRLRVRRRS